MSDDLAYAITSAMFENIANFRQFTLLQNQTTVELACPHHRSHCTLVRSATLESVRRFLTPCVRDVIYGRGASSSPPDHFCDSCLNQAA
jgi:hypothetical protein